MRDHRDVMTFAIDNIFVDPKAWRLPFNPAAAAALGREIGAHGQLTPISVRPRANAEVGRKDQPYEPIDGLHRLDGMRSVGIAVVVAHVVHCRKDEVRGCYVAANLHRRLLTVIELAVLIGELWQTAEIISAGSARDRAEATAAIIGRSSRTVFNYLKLQRKLVVPFPQLLSRLFQHEISNDYTALAQIANEPREEFRHDALIRALSPVEAGSVSASDKPKREYGDGFGYKWTKATVDEQRALAREVIRGTRLKAVPTFLAEIIQDTSGRKRPAELVAEALQMVPDSGVSFLRDSLAGLSDRDREAVIAEFRFPGTARRIG